MGGILLYKPYKYVPPKRPVGFLGVPGVTTGQYTLPILSGIGYGFRGSYGNVSTYLSFQFQMNKKEIEIYEFEMHLGNYDMSDMDFRDKV